jgi:hypothetical protein
MRKLLLYDEISALLNEGKRHKTIAAKLHVSVSQVACVARRMRDLACHNVIECNTPLDTIYMRSTCDIVTGCMNWNGYINERGYGHMRSEHDTILVHRIAYMEYYGKIDKFTRVTQICCNKRCVRKSHLVVY